MDSFANIYQQHWSPVVTQLTKAFGASYLDQIENATQEAFVKGIENWAKHPPDDVRGWIYTVAKNKLTDQIRRGKTRTNNQEPLTRFIENSKVEDQSEVFFEGELDDNLLKMLFVCCHPKLPPETHIHLHYVPYAASKWTRSAAFF